MIEIFCFFFFLFFFNTKLCKLSHLVIAISTDLPLTKSILANYNVSGVLPKFSLVQLIDSLILWALNISQGLSSISLMYIFLIFINGAFTIYDKIENWLSWLVFSYSYNNLVFSKTEIILIVKLEINLFSKLITI